MIYAVRHRVANYLKASLLEVKRLPAHCQTPMLHKVVNLVNSSTYTSTQLCPFEGLLVKYESSPTV